MNHHHYRPLDAELMEIRLIAIEAGTGSGLLQCQLKCAFLSDDPTPEYETISYHWGDPNLRSQICLGGRNTFVPATAEQALRRVRLPDRRRVVWIDAVCINQQDPPERNSQVALMGQIYANTQKNLVWLGEDDDDDDIQDALRLMELVLHDASKETDDFKRLSDLIWTQNGVFQYSTTGLPFQASFDSLLRFYTRPWFRRLWVVQECALPKQSVCYSSDAEIVLLDVLRAASWLSYKRRFLPFDILRHPGVLTSADMCEFADHNYGRFRQQTSRNHNFYYLLSRFRHFLASDARDHVFGLLGLYQVLVADGKLHSLLTPNYQKSLPDVLRDATRYAIEQIGDLHLFRKLRNRTTDKSTGDSFLPSWVPEWQNSSPPEESVGELGWFFRCDDGVPMMICYPGDVTDANVLTLSGFEVGTVSHQTQVITRGVLAMADEILRLLESARSVSKAVLPAARDDSHDHHLSTIFIAGQNSDRRPDGVGESFRVYFDYLEQRREVPPDLRELNASKEHNDDSTWMASRYHLALAKACGNRRIFATASGFLGVGPQRMKEHDVLAVIFGSRWPLVLREQANGHEIVGLCYVYGIMQGEHARKLTAEDAKRTMFNII